MPEYTFDLKVILPNGKTKSVQWDGPDGLKACQRYADAHPGHSVVAWRWPTFGVFVGPATILEPPQWKE